ncbi:clc-like domain-containing protein [Ditylenchus destructor]|uniref:Clc-like domain-containing protein n=1 Tax=Ditylenchus destructor TaxID=166010 RepID=A0AAD4R829_9BILA|nr:clc-like domain-containing protein [Ditylenchus destructor]
MVLPFSGLQVGALACGFAGVITSFVALSTPAWQVVFARELMQWIQSGLWLNCQTRPSGMNMCTYTFSDSDFDFYTSAELTNLRTPPFYAWQRNLLAVLLFAQLLAVMGILSVLFSFYIQTKTCSAIGFIVGMGLSVIIHVGASLAFAILSQMVEYRFFHVSVSGIYEKQWGYSFYVELCATFLLITSLLLAIVHLIFLRNSAKGADRPQMYQQQQALFRDGIAFDTDSPASYRDDEYRFAMRELPPIPQHRYN